MFTNISASIEPSMSSKYVTVTMTTNLSIETDSKDFHKQCVSIDPNLNYKNVFVTMTTNPSIET